MSDVDLDGQALGDPDEYERLLRGYHHLLGSGAKPRDDLRASAIPQTLHLDRRRYSIGLDRITAHLRPLRAGELVVVGAREGHGKSAFVERLALDNSLRHRVLYTTLELTAEETRDRMAAKLMRCSVDEMHAERKEDGEKYCEAMAELRQRDLMIWEPKISKERTIQAITKRALDVSAPLVIVDWTRMIEGWRIGSREPDEIMKYLRSFVRSVFITVVVVAQLNRDAALRRPHAAQLQDTGLLEQLADRVLLLWRPFLGQPQKDRICEIIACKNRKGPPFRGHAGWVGQTMNFYDFTDEEEALAQCCHKKATKGTNE